VVLRAGAQAEPADLIAFAAERLAEFKVPRRILILPEIPKGPTGKPQRIGLAKRLGLDMERQNEHQPHVEPATSTEKAIADIWRSVLKRDAISTRASFFDIGGDSILATRIVARVHDQLGQDVPVVVLFQAPTIADMARAIDAQASAPAEIAGTDPEHLAKLLAEIEAMSEDEAEREVRRLGEEATSDLGEAPEHKSERHP
jgi:acyl carrier protein